MERAGGSGTRARRAARAVRELPNDGRENPCFGCGPNNVRGLRLRFFDDGRTVRSELAPRPEFEGWPSNWNLGLVITAAIEVAGWALWERLGPSVILNPMRLEGLGRIELALPLAIVAERRRRGRQDLLVSTVRQRGRPVLRVTIPVARMGARDARASLAAYPRFPNSMRRAFEELARREPERGIAGRPRPTRVVPSRSRKRR